MAKHLIGRDGKTPCERLLGKRSSVEAFEFGEQVQYSRRTTDIADEPAGASASAESPNVEGSAGASASADSPNAEGPNSRSRKVNVANMDSRWATGTYLGQKWGTTVHIIAVSPLEVIEVRSVMRKTTSERWDREAVESLCATPWCWHVRPADMEADQVRVIPYSPEGVDAIPPPRPRPPPRRLKITTDMLREHGYTANCRKCTSFARAAAE